MATEKKWMQVPSQFIQADGGIDGLLTIPDTSPYRVKQKVKLVSNSLQVRELEVKRVISPTQMYLGLSSEPIFKYKDLSEFTVADASRIYADEQDRPSIIPDAYNRAMYEEEPIMAKRVILVDKNGRKYDLDNPVPTNATFTGSLTINLSGDGADGDTVGIVGVGGERLVINPDGSMTVKDPEAVELLTSIFNILDTGTLDVNDANTQSALLTVISILNDIFNFQSTQTQSVSDATSHTKLDSLISALSTINSNLLDIESAINSGLQSVVDELQQINADINANIDQLDTNLGNKLDDIDLSITTGTDAIVNEIEQLDTNLGGKLDSIEAALSNLDADTLWTKLSKSVDRSRVSSYSDVVVSGRTLKRLDYVEYSATSVSLTQKIRVSYTWLDFGTKDERVGPIVRQVLNI